MKYTSLQIHAFSFKTVQKQKSKTFIQVYGKNCR